MLTYFLTYLLCGAIVGFCAGLLGIGGGIMGIPMLFALFRLQGIDDSMAMHSAIGTVFATVVMTSLASIYAHYCSGMILFRMVKKMIPGLMVGCLLGIILASQLNGIYLQRLFGFFLLALACQYFFKKEIKKQHAFPGAGIIFLATIAIGVVSGLLGLGGGIFIVPYLGWYGISMRHAIATSSVCIFPIAILGMLGYMYVGVQEQVSIAYSSGFVNWPAFVGISLTSILCAPLGARVTHTISPSALKKVFALFLMGVGMSMLLCP